jgi:hypothetical protein
MEKNLEPSRNSRMCSEFLIRVLWKIKGSPIRESPRGTIDARQGFGYDTM